MADLHDRLLPLGHGSNDQGLAAIKGRSTCVLAGGQSEAQKGSQVQKKFILALIFSFTFMIVEVIGGYFANSLAIMTDAAHLLSDVGGFGVSIFAAYYASKRSQQSHTFGYHRVEVLAALASVLCSWAVTGVLVAEAVHRIMNPTPVNGKLMFFLSLTGIAVNILNLLILGGHHHHGVGGHDHSHDHSSHGDSHSHVHSHGSDGHSHGSHDHSYGGHDHSHGSHGHDHDEANINLRGAVIHVLGDFVQSIGVAVAGALIWWKQDNLSWQLADPICTFVFALLVLLTTRAILGDIWDILMERVPRKMDIDKMEKDMLAVDGVAEVHDLHVWGIKPGMPILAAHVTTQSGKDGNAVLGRVTAYCRSVGIDHSTIQISDQDVACPCNTYPDSSTVGHNQQDASQAHDHSDRGHDHNHSHQHDHKHGHNGSQAETVNGHSHAAHDHGKHDHTHSHGSNDMV